MANKLQERKMIRTMSGEEIAQELGTIRQYISNTIKSGLRKIYKSLKRKNPDMSPFELINAIMNFFEIRDTEEIRNFWTCFPPDIRNEVENSMEIM